MKNTEYSAIVVGAGPNGLAAAIRLQQEGHHVLVVEGSSKIGGGTRTEELTLPGFYHDVCSAVHPMATMSPFFKTLPLHEYGLEWARPVICAAHPFDNGTAAALYESVDETASHLGLDGKNYKLLMEPVVEALPDLLPSLLSPFPDFTKFLPLARFGIRALPPSSWTKLLFQTEKAKGLWAGMAGHAIQPLSNWITSAIGLMLMSAAHVGSWPVPKGGSKRITDALAAHFLALGGEIRTDFWVKSWKELPKARAVLFDVTPKQLLSIMGDALPDNYRRRLERYRYGMGVCKVDWAVSEPVPFRAAECRHAGTVHLGGTFEEIAAAEAAASVGRLPKNPFVLLTQPSIFDHSRAPEGKHTVWAYCHVPHGSNADRTEAIENQIERFAPGFKDTILAKHTYTAVQMEAYNPNYVGGDINGGVQDIFQHFSRPILSTSPYRTAAKGIYLCSSATPPGGGVHGMCGFHAAERALRDKLF